MVSGWTRFFDLLERSIIVQSFVTAVLVGVSCALYVMGKDVPDGLQTLTMTVVAFWMGSKVQHTVDNSRQAKET